jgi:hypothetical protein
LFLWQTGGFKRICIYKMYIFSITDGFASIFFLSMKFSHAQKSFTCEKKWQKTRHVLHFQLQRQHKYLWWVYFHTS